MLTGLIKNRKRLKSLFFIRKHPKQYTPDQDLQNRHKYQNMSEKNVKVDGFLIRIKGFCVPFWPQTHRNLWKKRCKNVIELYNIE